MSTLITNLPSYEVWVRKEYLTDHKSGHGEFVKGVWVSAKSIPGRAFYFETYLPEYAAMFDKLPISAFLSSPEIPDPDMTLHNLQFWNCMDYGVVAVQKQFIGSMHDEVYTRDFGNQTGTYITEARPKKTRQGRGKHSKYSATSRNSARKRYRGQGR